ncbi:MAG: PAS domain-containing protein [Rhodospirillales bacterium]
MKAGAAGVSASLFEHLPLGLAVFDWAGTLIQANSAFGDGLGLPPSSEPLSPGRGWEKALPPETGNELIQFLDGLRSGSRCPRVCLLPPVRLTGGPMAGEGGEMLWVRVEPLNPLEPATWMSEAERELRFQKSALDQHAIVSITDVRGTITYANDKFCEISGYGREELIGRNHRMLNSGEHSPEFFQSLWRTIASGQVWQGDIKNRAKNGSHYWVRATIVPFLNAEGKPFQYVAIRTDTTALHAMQETLERQNARLDSVLSNTNDAYLMTDSDWRISYANRQFGELFGLNVDTILSVDLARATPDIVSIFFKKMLRARNSGQNQEAIVFYAPNGVYVEAYITPFADGVLSCFRDVTKWVQAERNLVRTTEEAERANRAKSEFLATMSHDLRTPLNAIIGFAELMEAKIFGPLGSKKYDSYVADIRNSGRFLVSLVNDILDLSKIEAGKYELDLLPLAAADLIEDALTMVGPLALAKAIRIDNDVEADCPKLIVDERAFVQILVNLLSNAIKYSPDRSAVRIAAAVGKDGAVCLTVSDQGFGMTKDELVRILDPFTRADSRRSLRFEGTGLGLYLCRQLMDLHGGRLTVTSEVDKGTTVTLSFPRTMAGKASQ